jgi:uncharacterized protein (DUF58 family)
MIRPTRRAALLFAAVLPVPWMLLSYRPSLWPFAFAGSALLLSAMAADAVLARPRRALLPRVHAPESSYVGEPIHIAVEFTAPAGLPPSAELALDLSGDARPRAAAHAPLRGSLAQRIQVTTSQRGLANVDAVWLRWQGPLRLIEQTRQWASSAHTAVLPNTRAARGEELSLLLQDAIYGVKQQHGAGEGSEFEALREYSPGLDARFIDWKHSARHRRMLVREFQIERNHSIVLALDTGYLMREPLEGVPRLDHAIAAALLLARVAIHAGDLAGMYTFDSRPRHYVSPARGFGAFRRLQQASAAIAYSHEETNFTLGLGELHARLPRRSLIVLLTEFVDTITAEMLLENIRRLTSRHLVVFVTFEDQLLDGIFHEFPANARRVCRAVLADQLLRERRITLEKLERLGIQCLDAPPSRLSVALINRYLRIKQRGLL